MLSGPSERWLPVVGFDRYEVSDLGRVRNPRTGRVLKLRGHPTGPAYVTLSGPDGLKQVPVRRLVLEAFCGPPPSDKPHVIHENQYKLDARLVNLRWGRYDESKRRQGPRPCLAEHVEGEDRHCPDCIRIRGYVYVEED